MANETDNKQLRSFGLTVGGMFALIGLWPLVLHNDNVRWWALIIAGLLVVPALIFPRSLASLYKPWMAMGHIMGWVNTRIILGILFYVVVTPIGVIRRMLGKDPMGKKIESDLKSYRINRTPRPASHLRQQY